MKTKTKLILMLPGEPEQECEVELDDPPSLEELHNVLDPRLGTDTFEHVRVYAGAEPGLGIGAYRDMFVDETGAVKEPPLPRNEAATELYRRNWLNHEGGKADDLPPIFGPAVYFPDRRVW